MSAQLLRFISCGSVDDGKSTLIGRLVFDCGRVFDDQLRGLEKDSRTFGTRGDAIDFALLLDGLEAEREQGITIDVAYRYFSTPARSFILADTPGHEQYTRNMATAASTADLAVLLIDARKGVLQQSRRHTRIAAMFGITQIVLAVNKMDLIDFSSQVFESIAVEYGEFAKSCGVSQVVAVPTCAIDGDNVVSLSPRMPWYQGPTIVGALESAPVGTRFPAAAAFRMPVQWVNRANPDFRGYCGRIASGQIKEGDAVRILPSEVTTSVKEVIRLRESSSPASAGESVTLTLSDDVDLAKGDLLCDAAEPSLVADQFMARLLWMDTNELIPGRQYFLKLHEKEVSATVTEIKFVEDVNSGAHLAAKSLQCNDLAVVNIATSARVPFEPYAVNRQLGAFILIDKQTFATVGAGMIVFELRRSSNLHRHEFDVNGAVRARMKNQRPICIWLTGLSGSGKSTIANRLEKRLFAQGRHTYLLDGDNVRHGLNKDLGFADVDRVENIRRVAEVARLMADAGLIVIVALISPFRSERRMARELFPPGDFIEVFVDTPLEECERRDPKALYAKARAGTLKNFSGIDSQYEIPEQPEISLMTAGRSVDDCVEELLNKLPAK